MKPDTMSEHPAASAPEPGLGRAAARGVAWQGLSYLCARLLVLAATVVLARLLAPRDFGVVGLALVFITYADVVTDLGVAEALVFLPPDRRRNDAALLLSILFSILLVGLAMAVAPAAARFFHRPDLTTLFRVLSLSLFLGATGQVPDALIRKDLRFQRRMVSTVARSAVQGTVSIVLAAAGAGPWAIVWGYLAGDLAWSVAGWSLVGYRPGLGFWRAGGSAIRPLLRFGVPSALHGLVVSLLFDIDYLIVGRVLGPTALGLYTLGFRVPELVIINVFYVLSAVAFPVFSRTRGDRDRLRRGYLTGLRLQTVYGVGAGVGLACVAPMLVRVLFGRQWEASIAPLEALALYAAFRSVGNSATDLYKGLGRPGLAFAVSAVRLVVLVPAILVAARSDIEAVAWTQMGLALVFALMMQAVATRLVGVSVPEFVSALVPALAVAVGTALGAGAVRLWLPGSEGLRLAAAIAAGAGLGVAVLWRVDGRFLRELRGLLGRPERTSTSMEAPA
jgi:PST family polysaccharide transporter